MIDGGVYKDQVKSKKWRGTGQLVNKLNRLHTLILEGRKPSFKRTYKGNFTKRYLALMHAVRTKQAMTEEAFNEWTEEHS